MMARTTEHARPPALACPTHNAALDGGPTVFWCPTGRHGLQAADLDFEYAPAPRYNAPVIALFAYAAAYSWLQLVYLAVTR